MSTVTIQIPEEQVIEWVRHLSLDAKRAVIRELIPSLNELDEMVDYGSARMRELCVQRGLDWDTLSNDEREHLIDELLHQN